MGFIEESKARGKNKVKELFDEQASKPRRKIKVKQPSDLTKPEAVSKEYLIKSILAKGSPDFKGLGCGVHNDVYYFGVSLYYNSKPLNAVVSSDKRIFVNWGKYDNQIRKDFGLEYRYPFFAECLDHKWSNEGVNNWLYGDVEPVSLKEVYESIKEFNEGSIYHHNPVVHSFVGVDIVASYFVPLFEAIGRSFFEAERRSGKTEQGKIYQQLCFNPIFSSNITGSSLFRIIESTKATIIIDDFDLLPEQQKNDNVQIVRTGYKKDIKTLRADGKNFKPRPYNIFSHLVLNNTLGLDPITEDRCNKILMLRSVDNKLTSNRPNFKEECWFKLREKLYICALQNWKQVQESYETLEVEGLGSRDLEKCKPHLAIAKLISEDVYKELLKFFIENNSQADVLELEGEWGFIIVKWLYNNVKEEKEIFVADIVEGTKSNLDFDEEHKDYKQRLRGYSIWVGKYLKNYSSLFKGKMVNGRAKYLVIPENVVKLIKLKNYEEHIPGFNPKTLVIELLGNNGMYEEGLINSVKSKRADLEEVDVLELLKLMKEEGLIVKKEGLWSVVKK